MGVVDNSYCGDNDVWMMPVIAMEDTTINKNDRICQFRIEKIQPGIDFVEVERLGNKNRGGMWEDTHGGVQSGETSMQAMRRELKEEIGLDVKEEELKLVRSLKRKNIYRDCYVLFKDIDIKDISFNDNEVMDCKYVSLEKFEEMINDRNSPMRTIVLITYNDKDLYFRIKSYDNTTYNFILTCEYVDTINSKETFVIHTLKVSKENGEYNMTTKYINL